MMNIRLFCVASLLAACSARCPRIRRRPPTWPSRSRRQHAPAPPTRRRAGIGRRRRDRPAGTVPAIWVTREVSFVYFSTTSLYYCDGLRDKVSWVMSSSA